jgi:hypothetical protein
MCTVTRRSILAAFLAGAGALTSACLSPTLPPSPPPDAPSGMRFVTDGELLVEGDVPARDARVMLINQETALISGQVTKDGHYALRIRAEVGDYLELWYEQGLYASSPRGFQAPVMTEPPGAGTTDGAVDSGPTGAVDSGASDGGASDGRADGAVPASHPRDAGAASDAAP